MQAYFLRTPTQAPSPNAALAAAMLAGSETCIRCVPRQMDVDIPLDSDVIDALQTTGSDWGTRFNDILRQWLKTNS